MDFLTVKVAYIFLMVHFFRDGLIKEKSKDKTIFSSILMDLFIEDRSKILKRMGLEYFVTIMVLNMKDIGKMMNLMVKNVFKHTQMEVNILVNFQEV